VSDTADNEADLPGAVSSERRLERIEPFRPLRPTPRRRRIALFVVGPLLWLVALLLVAIVVNRTDAIETGILVALAAVALSLVVLSLLRAGRNRERRRDARRR
jgi:predicted lysophospholipase L1 biosynthesis ABC-type transport system permease subunit